MTRIAEPKPDPNDLIGDLLRSIRRRMSTGQKLNSAEQRILLQVFKAQEAEAKDEERKRDALSDVATPDLKKALRDLQQGLSGSGPDSQDQS